jgi:hypothetical protein
MVSSAKHAGRIQKPRLRAAADAAVAVLLITKDDAEFAARPKGEPDLPLPLHRRSAAVHARIGTFPTGTAGLLREGAVPGGARHFAVLDCPLLTRKSEERRDHDPCKNNGLRITAR